MNNNNRIEIKIAKTEDGSISVNTKMAEDATEDEAVQLLLDFIGSVVPGEKVTF